MEYWEVCNACGDRTGQIRPKGAFFGPGEYHPAMEAWIKNSRGEILIQQRSVECEILPGAWGLTTGRMIPEKAHSKAVSGRSGKSLAYALPPLKFNF